MRGARNIAVAGMPSSVEVGGIPYAVATDFRVGIQCERILDDPALSPAEQCALVVDQHFYGMPERPPACPETVAAVLGFHAANEFALFDAGKARGRAARSWCWDYDMPLVVADFQREYGIDLTDGSLGMHWWRFMALFRGLSDGSRCRGAVAARTADERKAGGADRARAVAAAKAAVALPPRTREEQIEIEKERYGIG